MIQDKEDLFVGEEGRERQLGMSRSILHHSQRKGLGLAAGEQLQSHDRKIHVKNIYVFY